jgi:hypothetical protein
MVPALVLTLHREGMLQGKSVGYARPDGITVPEKSAQIQRL